MQRCQKGANLAQFGTGLAPVPRAYLFEKESAPLRNAVEIPTEPHRLPPPARKTGRNSVSGGLRRLGEAQQWLLWGGPTLSVVRPSAGQEWHVVELTLETVTTGH
jgi:hypothetical protein